MSIQPEQHIANKKPQVALQLSGSLFRTLIENSSDIVALVTSEGIVTYVSPPVTRVMGYTPEDLLGRQFRHLLHPDDLPLIRQTFATILQSPGQGVTAEYRLQCKDGSWKWFEGTGINLLHDPTAHAIVGNFRDITRRKQVEQERDLLLKKVQQSEVRLRRLMESNIIGVVFSNEAGSITDANDAYLQMVGYTRQELIEGNVRWLEMTPSEYLYLDTLGIEEAQRRGACTPYEKEYIRKDGSRVPILIGYALLEGSQTDFICFILDLTQRKAVEQALMQERKRLDDLVENVPGVVWEVWCKPDKAQQRINFVSHYLETMLGYSVEEWTQTPNFWLTIVHPEDKTRAAEEAAAILADTKERSTRFRWLRKDGQAVWVEAQAVAVKDEHGQRVGVRGVTMDISARMELDQRKDDFMSMASHELKTPVTSLKAYTQLLIRKFEKEGMDEPVVYLTRMDNQIDKLTRLIRDLLDVSKAQTGKLDYQETPIDIDTLLRETVEAVQQTTTRHTLLLHGTSNATVLGDSERLSQVLINLLNNAIKYSPQAHSVDIQLATSSNTVIVSVQDYGVGIAKVHQDKLFERFYRVYENSNKLFPGLGIGLYISYEIVKRHKGEITLISEEDKGSTFSVTLPIVPRSE